MTSWVLERILGPEDEPVTLAEMRLHLREYTAVTDNDSEYSALIAEGREWVEHYTGRALVDQTWRLTLTQAQVMASDPVAGTAVGYQTGAYSWQRSNEIVLRPSPVIEVTSVKTVDAAGTETTVDPATYEVRETDGKWPRLVALSGSTWNMTSSTDIQIVMRVGYLDHTTSPATGQVPESFKRAIKLYASSMYETDKDLMDKLLEAAKCVLRPWSANLSLA